MALRDDLLAELDALIREGTPLVGSFRDSRDGVYSEVPELDLQTFVTSNMTTLLRIDPEHAKAVPDGQRGASLCWSHVYVAGVLGAILSLHRAIDKGRLQTLESRIRSAIEDDVLQQARDLLAAGYHGGAMVIVGGILEQRLREICQRRGVMPQRPSLSAYNEALRNAEYDQPTWRAIQAHADVRNNAAHGDFQLVTVGQVEDALRFVERFLVEHPA